MLIGWSAHIVMPALAFSAGADGAQPGEGIAAFFAVIPLYDQFTFVAVSGDVCRSYFFHEVNLLVGLSRSQAALSFRALECVQSFLNLGAS